jgi:hypothetical protein
MVAFAKNAPLGAASLKRAAAAAQPLEEDRREGGATASLARMQRGRPKGPRFTRGRLQPADMPPERPVL